MVFTKSGKEVFWKGYGFSLGQTQGMEFGCYWFVSFNMGISGKEFMDKWS
jgi:hypothetical protein